MLSKLAALLISFAIGLTVLRIAFHVGLAALGLLWHGHVIAVVVVVTFLVLAALFWPARP